MSTIGITFQSHGCKLLGRLWLAKGEGAKPTMVLLHGLPGIDQNHDLAYALKNAGWNSLIFHYRGCWGSEGDFSLPQNLEDAAAVIDQLSKHPEVDENRLFLFGHSMGGWVALMTGGHDRRIKGVVTAAAVIDWQQTLPVTGDEEVTEGIRAFVSGEMTPFLGGTSTDQLMEEFQVLPSALEIGEQLNGRSLLLICGEKDFEGHLIQAKVLHENYSDHSELIVIPEADHGFSWERDELIRLVLGWLEKR